MKTIGHIQYKVSINQGTKLLYIVIIEVIIITLLTYIRYISYCSKDTYCTTLSKFIIFSGDVRHAHSKPQATPSRPSFIVMRLFFSVLLRPAEMEKSQRFLDAVSATQVM